MSYCLRCAAKKEDCCRTDYAKFTTIKDVERIARHLKKSINDVVIFGPLSKDDIETDLFVKKHHVYYYDLADPNILQLKKNPDGSCIHLHDDGSCGIYIVRPLSCRMYPFWHDGKTIIDNNGLTCPIIEMKKHNDLKIKEIGHKKREMQRLGEQLEREIKHYKRNIKKFSKEI